MKMCPNCKTLNDDYEHYCTECRYKLEGAQFVPNPRFSRHRSIGCLIVLAIAILAIVLAFIQPGLYQDESKKNFASGFLKMIPSRPPPSASRFTITP